MNLLKKSLSFVLGLCLLAVASDASAFDWGDNFIGYRWGANFHEPTIDSEITKNIIQFGHASRYFLGSNFLNVDILMSDSNDPANGAGSGGATEIYVTYRHQLNFNKAFKAPVKWWIVRDLSLTTGFDINTKDTAFAPRKKAIVVGPTLNFDMPKGFLDVGVWYYQEWNHNSFAILDKDVDFDPTAMLNVTWGIPVPTLWNVDSIFKGFCNVIFPKGKDGALNETETEVLLRTSWMFDVGALITEYAFGTPRKGAIYIGPGLEFWYNKFGNPEPIPAGNTTRPNHTTICPTIQAEIHF